LQAALPDGGRLAEPLLATHRQRMMRVPGDKPRKLTGGLMGAKCELSPQEWRTLQFAPFWMLSAVVGAYRKFDPLEYEAFSRSLQLAVSAPGRLSQEVMTSVASDLRRIEEEFRADPRTIASGLHEVAVILSKVPCDEADAFKDALIYVVGEGVATARGRFGRVMSDDDAKDLEMIAQLLLIPSRSGL
jgi:hypothetical protein